jgi:hypothetical protein
MPKPTAQVLITVKRTKRKTQPYTFTINKPGGAPVETAAEYYSTKRSAIRGALRKLDAWDPSGEKKATHSWRGKVYPVNIAEA